MESLENAPWVQSFDRNGPGDLRIAVAGQSEAETNLVQLLGAAGAAVISITPEGADLEDVFLELTS